jgi:predicted PurR-regulated permease PerM
MKDNSRILRSRIFYTLLFLFGIILTIYLVAILQSLILPTLIGFLLAYITKPVLTFLEKKKIPRAFGVIIIILGWILIFAGIGQKIISLLPNEKQALVIRVNAQSKINDLYLSIFGKTDFDSQGNFMDNLFGEESKAVIISFNRYIKLSPDEEKELLDYLNSSKFSEAERTKVITLLNKTKQIKIPKEKVSKKNNGNKNNLSPFELLPSIIPTSEIAIFFSEISKWIVMPFVFLFILLDNGEIKKFIINLLPNRYFEMSFAVFDNVDKALGKYLRGTVIQSSLVGSTIIIGLLLIGFNVSSAIFIGLVAGISNVIPYLGPLIGYGAGILYGMIVGQLHPVLPFIPQDAAIWGSVIVVFIAQFLDNTVFQPFVLGKAVNLHPLVIILGVMGGGIAFGFWGMFLAIPTIVVFRVIIATIYQQLKNYQLIY